jgi:hypothetical protein
MAAIGTAGAQALIAEAAEVGVTVNQIATYLRIRPTDLDVMSGGDRDGVRNELIAEARRRSEAHARVMELCRLAGRDADAVAASITGWTEPQLRKLIADQERHMRSQGKNIHPARRPQPDAPATDRQVDHIANLLRRRTRDGDGDGFVSTKGLLRGGRPVRAEIAKLTRQEASTLIDSLHGDY